MKRKEERERQKTKRRREGTGEGGEDLERCNTHIKDMSLTTFLLKKKNRKLICL